MKKLFIMANAESVRVGEKQKIANPLNQKKFVQKESYGEQPVKDRPSPSVK